MRLLLPIVVAISIAVLPGCDRHKEGNNYSHVDSDDAAMNAAIARARETSGNFLQAFREQKPGFNSFHVKKPYPTPSGGREHMWIEVQEENDGVLKGIVVNDAEETHEVKIGQAVTLNISEITDWKYLDGKKLVGGYTIRYFIDRLPPTEREGFMKEAGFEL